VLVPFELFPVLRGPLTEKMTASAWRSKPPVACL
jgi:hypothetical protein